MSVVISLLMHARGVSSIIHQENHAIPSELNGNREIAFMMMRIYWDMEDFESQNSNLSSS
jgi:hypothetical protein